MTLELWPCHWPLSSRFSWPLYDLSVTLTIIRPMNYDLSSDLRYGFLSLVWLQSQTFLLTFVIALHLTSVWSSRHWPLCDPTHSYDPWTTCMYNDLVEIYNGRSWSIWPLWTLGLIRTCVLRSYRWINSAHTRIERITSLCGHHNPWPLLENRPFHPLPQASPALDALRRAISTMVERRCSTSSAGIWYK